MIHAGSCSGSRSHSFSGSAPNRQIQTILTHCPSLSLVLFQRICRRLLAVYDLPSWGRCELALSLLLEHGAPYSLEDVVQAVRESHDREFIKRVLAKECPICLSVFPHSKVGALQVSTDRLWRKLNGNGRGALEMNPCNLCNITTSGLCDCLSK